MKENTVSLKVAQIFQIEKEAAPLFNFSVLDLYFIILRAYELYCKRFLEA